MVKFNRKFINRDIQTLPERTRRQVEPFLKLGPCPLCKGARLNQAALNCRINGYNIAQLAVLEVDELIEVVREIDDPAAAPLVRTLTERLGHLVQIGLEYLSLDRATDTLSAGESQRVKMVKHLGGSLVDVMYIFDEPSVGLHPRDVHRAARFRPGVSQPLIALLWGGFLCPLMIFHSLPLTLLCLALGACSWAPKG